MQFRTSALYAMLAFAISAVSAQNAGQATFFSPGLGSCGHFNTDADFIVAVSSTFFNTFPGAGANPNANPVCGKQLTASAAGKSVTVTVVDSCPGCAQFDIDLSPAAFSQLADQSVGRIDVTWTLA